MFYKQIRLTIDNSNLSVSQYIIEKLQQFDEKLSKTRSKYLQKILRQTFNI